MTGEYLGCMSGNCVVEKPEGMHTNGRCSCLDGLRFGKRVVLLKAIERDRERIAQLEQRLAQLEQRLAAASGDGLP